MTELKEQLRTDLTEAMRARDQVRLRTLRMALTSITNEEVSGDSVHELSDEQVLKVLTREAKKRREAADAFAAAGRLKHGLPDRGRSRATIVGKHVKGVLGLLVGADGNGIRHTLSVRRNVLQGNVIPSGMCAPPGRSLLPPRPPA